MKESTPNETHIHRCWLTPDKNYAFCQCGEVYIRDGERYRDMTRDEQRRFNDEPKP